MSKAALPQADLYEVNEVAADLIRQQAGDLIAGLSRTRKEVVRRVLAQGVSRGWSDAVLRRRVAEVVGLDPRRAQALEHYRQGQLNAGVPPGRAERQARAYAKRLLADRLAVITDHEVRTALQRAQRFVWQDMQARGDLSPYAVRVTVVHKDERLCPVCKPQHGRRRSLNRDLTEGPPFHPRCRCDEEVQDRGVEKRETEGPDDDEGGPVTLGSDFKHPHLVAKHLPGEHSQQSHGRRHFGMEDIGRADMKAAFARAYDDPDLARELLGALDDAQAWLDEMAQDGKDYGLVADKTNLKRYAVERSKVDAEDDLFHSIEQELRDKYDRMTSPPKDYYEGHPWDDWMTPEHQIELRSEMEEKIDHLWQARFPVSKARKPVDGDGDLKVYDSTPRERPATPAEVAAGRAQRAGKKAAPAAKKAAAKKAPAKNDYDKRVDKFDRAIAQAVKAGDKKKVKQVHDLIGQDFILKKPDRDDLQNVLAARAAGKPDPAPKPGSNRAARGVKGADAPAAPAPAKKAAAPRPAAKKVAAAPPKKALPKKGSLPDVPQFAARIRDAKTKAEFDAIEADVDRAHMPKVDKDHYKRVIERRRNEAGERMKGRIREAAAKTPEFDLKPRKPSIRTIAPTDQSKKARVALHNRFADKIAAAKSETEMSLLRSAIGLAFSKGDLSLEQVQNLAQHMDAKKKKSTSFGNLPTGAETKAFNALAAIADGDEARLAQVERQVLDDRANGRIDLKTQLEIMAEVNRKRDAGKGGTTPHGQKTNAWKRLASRDIANATNFRKLKGLVTQISNKQASGQISEREAKELREKVYARLDELGLDRNGHPKAPARRGNSIASIARRMASVRRKVNAPPSPNQTVKAQITALAREMQNAKSMDVLDGIKARLQRPDYQPLREFMRNNPDELKALNAAYKAKKAELKALSDARIVPKQKSPTIQPPSQPNVARARAKANLPSDWGQKIGSAKNLSDVDRLMDDFEANKAKMSPSERAAVADALNSAMDKFDVAPNPEFVKVFSKRLGKKTTTKGAKDLISGAFTPEQVRSLVAAYGDTGVSDSDYEAIQLHAYERIEKIATGESAAEHKKLSRYGVPSRSTHPADNSPEAMLALHDHFSKGGTIKDAPVSGLWNFIQSDPDRFTVKPQSGVEGITPKYTIDDAKTGERWWVKADWTSAAVVEHGALKENWGGLLLQGMGIDAPFAKAGQNGATDGLEKGHGKFVLIQDAGEAMFGKNGRGAKVKGGYYGQGAFADVRKGSSPEGYARLHLLDYVMDNNDRHGGNVMGVAAPGGGQQIPLLDFGLGMGYWKHRVDPDMSPLTYLRNRARQDSVGDAILSDPDNKKHMAQVQRELRKVRVEKIEAMMLAQGQDPETVRLWGESMQNRIDQLLSLTPDQLVQIFARN